MPQTRVRVVGSGYTTLQYAGKNIAWLDSFTDSGQPTVGGGPAPIHPLGSRHPVEIVTGRSLGMGTLTATIFELWNQPVWYQLSGLAGRRTLIDVWEALAQNPSMVTCRMTIRPPQGAGQPRGKIYHNVVISAIPDDETVTIGALQVTRTIGMAYTHTTAA